MSALLERFIHTFQKAIDAEMAAMRQRLGSFEVPLGAGRRLDSGEEEGDKVYLFQLLQPSDKLALQMECTLRSEAGETLVTVADLNQAEVTLRSERPVSLDAAGYILVIYPWFLYERLKDALASLPAPADFYPETALRLFGQEQPHQQPRPLHTQITGLNASQLRAVQLCSDSNLAFVWGPPGTGKTTTLGHIVAELLGQGQRILITSTTNAAVDQALANLAGQPGMRPVFELGQIIRLGQVSGETFGTGLSETVRRLNTAKQARLEQLRARLRLAERQIEQCETLLVKLATITRPVQLDLFQEIRSAALTAWDLTPVFGEKLAGRIAALAADRQQDRLAGRRQRLERVIELSRQQAAQIGQELRRQESGVVQKTRVILATMTNVYLSRLLQAERFDTVIVEEAGMAILPTLFYCAALARHKIIMVGDPQQLPPIVQSRDDYVYRAMGRNIFEVTAQKPWTEVTRVMLDIQYRMHPVIGDLVSRLFYEGQLRHGENTAARAEIAAKQPYPGAPLIVVDTAGRTTAATEAGSFSRFNEVTAQLCIDLAVEAVRAGIESVAIITPYVAQSRLIRQLLARFQREAAAIECRTVHRFQGGERDMVILDTADTAPLAPGVLLTGASPGAGAANLLNVSLSRARGKLVILADVAYFRRTTPGSLINDLLAQAGQAGILVFLPRQ